MARLPEEQRMAVALVLVEGLSYKDAAETLGDPDRHADEPARARPRGTAGAARRQREPSMRFSDEMLMAYADGELDLVARAEIEAAMATRSENRAVRSNGIARLPAKSASAYDGVLEEPRAGRGSRRSCAAPGLGGSRRSRGEAARIAGRRLTVGRWRLPAWAALAASRGRRTVRRHVAHARAVRAL